MFDILICGLITQFHIWFLFVYDNCIYHLFHAVVFKVVLFRLFAVSSVTLLLLEVFPEVLCLEFIRCSLQLTDRTTYCYSKLDRPLQDSAWARYWWEWDAATEAQVLLLGPEHRLTGSCAVEPVVCAGAWCNTGWHAPSHTGEGVWVCWHSVSHTVRRPQWEQTPTRVSRVSNTAIVCHCFV